jgi:uncharacterized membrane protein (UPF0127 family)
MAGSAEADRLRSLPRCSVLGLEVARATGFRTRLLGLAGLEREQVRVGLLLPHCASVHTCGMRFTLDLVFLDADLRLLTSFHRVPPRRLVWHRGADAVLEIPSSQGGEFAGAKT